MKKWCRFISVLLCILLLLSLISCGGKQSSDSSLTDSSTTSEETNDTDSTSDGTDDTSSDSSNTGSTNGGDGGTTASGKKTAAATTKKNQTTTTKRQVDVSIYPKTLNGKTARILLWDTPTDNDKLMYNNFTKVTGCNVKFVQTTYENYAYKLSSMVASNDAPDTAFLIPRNYPSFILKDLLQPIDKYVKKDDPLLDFSAMNHFKFNDQYWGIASKSTAEHFVVFFNKTMFDEAKNVNKNPLELYNEGNWNWNTFADLVQKMVAKDSSGNIVRYGLALDRVHTFMDSTGIDFVTVNGNDLKNNIKDPRVKKAWEFIKELTFVRNYGIKVANPPSFFAQGKAAMCIEGHWAVDRGSNNAPLKSMRDKWDWVPFPKYPDGQSYQPIEAGVWGVPYRSKNPEAGYYLARWVIDPASLDGVEGAEKPNQYRTKADVDRLEVVYASNKFSTMTVGILGDALWDLWWDLLNPENQVGTVIDNWVPTINNHINRVLNEIPKKK